MLRYGNYPRVNQFDVEHNLNGLEEKFRVYNKDSLADALRQRLDELSNHSPKWTPEALHLLLELSDRPVHKSRLEDLEFLKPPEAHIEPILKWTDLVKEDPLLRDKIWKNIDYAAESSEDEGFSDSDAELSVVTETTQSSLDDDIRRPEDLAIPIDSESLERLQKEQFWRNIKHEPLSVVDAYFEKPKTYPITELQAIRETLFMLRGLPTTLYTVDANIAANGEKEPVPMNAYCHPGIIKAVSGFTLSGISSHVFYNILVRFSSYGTSLRTLRTWALLDNALMQRLQQRIQTRLHEFDEILSDLEGEYLAPQNNVVVSLAAIQIAVASNIHPFQMLAKLVQENYNWAPYQWLEALYDETCKYQMAENTEMYEFMGTLFFNCLEIYLRPMRRWMEDGELSVASGFFVKKDRENRGLTSLWEQYTVQNDHTGAPEQTPKFLKTSAHKVFTSGKSVVILKQLDRYTSMRRSWTSKEPTLDFQTVSGSNDSSLLPFSELFDSAFETWVQSKHHATSSVLRRCLFDSCGLRSSLDALEHIYFMADGATSSVLAITTFDDLSRGKPGWNDRFTLTELARDTLGQLPGVVADDLRIAVTPSTHDVLIARRTVKSLASINLSYHLPWAVSLIIRPSTLHTYQLLFTFLLQIRCAAHTLSSSRLRAAASEPPLYYGLRGKLLWFSSTLYNYLTDLVVRVNTEEMRRQMADAEGVDDMIDIHGSYVSKLAHQALLDQRLALIHKTILQILDLAISLEDARTLHSNMTASAGTVREGSPSGSESDSDSDSQDEMDEQEFSILPAQKDIPYPERLHGIKRDLERLTRFVVAGLRGVARAGTESNWDVLAEKLENWVGASGGRP